MLAEGHGLDTICLELDISLGQAETLLFGPEEKAPKPFVYKDEEPEAVSGTLLSPDHDRLCELVGELYEEIKKNFSAMGKQKIINCRSYTRYDSLMESITRVLYESSDFVYEDDTQAKTYILRHVARCMSTEGSRNRRAPEMIRGDADGSWWLSLMDYVDNPVGDIDQMMEVLQNVSDPYTVAIINEKRLGYTHEKIGQRLGCSKSTVTRRLDKALEVLKTIV